MTNATIVPLQQAFADITEPLTAIVSNVIAVATNLLTALPAIGQDLLGSPGPGSCRNC